MIFWWGLWVCGSRLSAEALGEGGWVFWEWICLDAPDPASGAVAAAEQGLKNLVAVEAGPHDPRLPEPVDWIVICDTLHHIENPGDYLLDLPRYLKPGGRLAVIDFRRDESPHWSSSLRIGVEDVDRWALQAGLVKTAEHDFIESNFFVVFSR